MTKISGILVLFCIVTLLYSQEKPAGEEAKGTKKYDQYEKPETCKSCHTD